MQTFHRLTLKIIYINIYMYTMGKTHSCIIISNLQQLHYGCGGNTMYMQQIYDLLKPLPPPKKKKKEKKDLSRQKSECHSFFPNYWVHRNKCWLETVLKFLIHLVISLCVYGSDLYIPGIQLIVHVFHGSCLLKLLGFFFLLSWNIVLWIILFN